MGDQPIKAKALLLPADGSAIKLVKYSTMERGDGDGNLKADFYDPVPNLRPWLGDAFQERSMATFYIDVAEQRNCDPVTRAFIKSNDPASHGRYCLYYTLFPTQPVNETCKRLIGIEPPSDRLFWRGDVLVVRYEGELGMGHEYLDAADTVLNAVEDLLRRAYASRGLERINEDERALEFEMERFGSFQLYTYVKYVKLIRASVSRIPHGR
jgi:hypothetical protein